MAAIKIVDMRDDGADWKCRNCNTYHPASKVKGIEYPDGKRKVLCLECLAKEPK